MSEQDRWITEHFEVGIIGTNTRAAAGRRVSQEMYTAEQAGVLLDVKPSLIYQWWKAERAAPAGMLTAAVPGGLKPLFTLAELQPLADRYHAMKARQARRRSG
ncbi:hypothetical protein [Nocardioides maradonensis]